MAVSLYVSQEQAERLYYRLFPADNFFDPEDLSWKVNRIFYPAHNPRGEWTPSNRHGFNVLFDSESEMIQWKLTWL